MDEEDREAKSVSIALHKYKEVTKKKKYLNFL
jgi:hypothetical protein